MGTRSPKVPDNCTPFGPGARDLLSKSGETAWPQVQVKGRGGEYSET